MQEREKHTDLHEFLRKSLLWRELCEERQEIDRHKWYESEKKGRDVGEDFAIIDWVVRHKGKWLAWRQQVRRAGQANGHPANKRIEGDKTMP